MVDAPSPARPAPPVLVFDGECGLCTTAAGIAERWVAPRGGRAAASQLLDLERLGLSREQCDEALQYVDAQGGVHSAQDAVAHLLLDSRIWWRPVGAALLLPGIHQLAAAAYRWVARHRHRLPGGTPVCAMPRPSDPAARRSAV